MARVACGERFDRWTGPKSITVLIPYPRRMEYASIGPLLMPHRQTVQHFAVELPIRHESVHERNEAAVMSRCENVNHLVHDDVFEAFAWFLR